MSFFYFLILLNFISDNFPTRRHKKLNVCRQMLLIWKEIIMIGEDNQIKKNLFTDKTSKQRITKQRSLQNSDKTFLAVKYISFL